MILAWASPFNKMADNITSLAYKCQSHMKDLKCRSVHKSEISERSVAEILCAESLGHSLLIDLPGSS